MNKVIGVLGVPCNSQGRWSGFYDAVMRLQTPPGTVWRQERGASAAANRNAIVQYALDVDADWVFFLDDDLVFGPDVLTQLLAHNVDAVVGLSLQRKVPFPPLIYGSQDARGWATPYALAAGERGMIRIEAATSGGFLVKTNVFRSMPAPWWTLGQIEGHSDGWGDDLHFCQKMRAAGFDLWCDLDVPFGHIQEMVLWPVSTPQGWVTHISIDRPIAQLPGAADPAWSGERTTSASSEGRLKAWAK